MWRVKMTFLEFLELVRTYRMLFGIIEAKKLFTKNIGLYYNLDTDTRLLSKLDKKEVA